MYTLPEFDETRLDVLHALMASHPLGTVVTHAGGLSAEHIPFEIAAPTPDAPHGLLRANGLWRRHGEDALVVFQGPSGYVSPSLYEAKATTGKVVPTWDYAVVHAHGSLRAVDDPGWMFALLERMSAHHEAARALPWSIHDAPREFIDRIMTKLVGIEIPLARLEGKWKMSQNRSAAERAAIAADVPALAACMRQPTPA